MSWNTLVESGLLDAPPTSEQIESAGLSDEDMKLLLAFWTPVSRPEVRRKDAVYATRGRRAGAAYARDFNPNQPRDDHGRWSDGGSGDSVKPDHNQDIRPSHGGSAVDHLAPVDPSRVDKGPGLTGRDAEIQDALVAKIAADPRAAAEEYKRIPSTQNGFILSGDDAKELSAEYRADRSLANTVHEPASWLTKQMYKDELEKPIVPGKSDIMFMAGGTGAGKSSSLRSAYGDKVFDSVQTVYDSNMAKAESGWSKIDAALESGRHVGIFYVDRDPEAAFESAISRAMKPDGSGKPFGRTVPIDAHVRTHMGARSTIERTFERYKDDNRVSVHLIDNNRKFSEGGPRTVSSPSQLSKYNYDGLEERLHARLDRAREEGRVTPSIYQGFLIKEGRGKPEMKSKPPPKKKSAEPQPPMKKRGEKIAEALVNGLRKLGEQEGYD